MELAFALPLLIMLIVGMVSAGVAYNHQLSLTHAAREGGRYAATLPVDNFADMNAWLDAVASQVEIDTTGTLGPGVPGHYICVAYVFPDGVDPDDTTTNRVDNGGAVSYPNPPQPCFADGRPSTERRVQIEVRRDTNFHAVIFSSTLTLDSEATNRFEAALGS